MWAASPHTAPFPLHGFPFYAPLTLRQIFPHPTPAYRSVFRSVHVPLTLLDERWYTQLLAYSIRILARAETETESKQ